MVYSRPFFVGYDNLSPAQNVWLFVGAIAAGVILTLLLFWILRLFIKK